MKRFFAIFALIGAFALTGCGSSGPTMYHPAAYGQNGHCYYINNPAEALALQAHGLCPHSWTPMMAPLAWQEMYYPYYSSPAYYNAYVPVRYRTVYISSERSFGSRYGSQIKTMERTATYKGTNGKTTSYSKINFGGGSRSSSFGGTRCSPIRSWMTSERGGGGGGGFGGGSRGGGGSFGGGSRSGSFGTSGGGSRSYSGTGSKVSGKSGC